MNTEPIVIGVEANPADFLADAKKIQNEMDILAHRLEKAGVSQSAYNKAVAQHKAAVSESIKANQSASMSLTDLRSAYQIVADVARVAGQVWEETGTKFVNYAADVRKLSEISGESAEETSRLIQVADDYSISADQLTTATKALTKEGLSPSLETLAQLSDQYIAIQSPSEKAAFLTKNFGKAGLEMAVMMAKGGDAIRASGDAIDESLILTQKAIDEARQYELAVDSMTDAWDAFTMQIGQQTVPTITKMLVGLTKTNEIRTEANRLLQEGLAGNREEALQMASATIQAAAAEDALKKSANETTAALDDNASSLADVAATNADIINGAISITKENENYQKSQDDVLAKIAETRAEGEKLYPWEHEKILENEKALEDLGNQYFENVEKQKAAQTESLAMMAIEKIAMSDGVAGYSDAEREKAMAVLTTQDVATAAAFEQQQAMEDLTTAVADGKISVEDYARIWDEASADGVISIGEVSAAIEAVPSSKTVTFDIVTVGAPPNLDTSAAASNAPVGTHREANQHSTGGMFMIPSSYGNEGFKMGSGDTASGGELISITPRGKDPNAAIVEAIYATRIDYNELARVVTAAAQQGMK